MSTEHQQYSTENQSEVIAEYAAAHGMEIVRSYADMGKSGLTLRHRDGLRQLLHDVENGTADFSTILVYDISRWGRFQDVDESAFYEYRCRRANIIVHYCAELFANDGSISSTILKALKRAMAGEYSRELSSKVFAGKSRLAELGFRQGGCAGHGLRRMLLDRNGKSKGLLARGDRKNLFTDRVILVPGPEHEVQIVREIYDEFVTHKRSPSAIARSLNERGIGNDFGRPWSLAIVRGILTNPKYTGANVSNRTSNKLSQRLVKNPPEMWIRRENAFTPIVDAELFRRAQQTMEARAYHDSDDTLLERLRTLWKRADVITGELIDRSPDMPSRAIYAYRFGSLLATYSRVGYVPQDDYSFIEHKKRLPGIEADCIGHLIQSLLSAGASVKRESESPMIIVNDEYTLLLIIVRCRHTKYRGDRWFVPPISERAADIRIAARLAPDNKSVMDYYAFPRSLKLRAWRDLGLTNNIFLDVHRFDDLTFLTNLARRSKIQEKA